MTNSNAPPVTPELLASLLLNPEVREAMREMLQHNGFPHALDDVPYPAQENLLAAMIQDGMITIGPGRVLSQEEKLALFDLDDDEESKGGGG